MEPGYMGWWYWFGMWIFGITSLVVTWWLFLDATRRHGVAARFIWPSLAAIGCVAQIPAFAMIAKADTNAGDTAAILGIIGFVMVLLGGVTYFSKGASRSGGSGWTMTTRNESVDPTRIRNGGAKPSVPVGVQPPMAPGAKDPRERTRPGAAGAPTNRIPGNTAPGTKGSPLAAPPTGAAATPAPGYVGADYSAAPFPSTQQGYNDDDLTLVDRTIADGSLGGERKLQLGDTLMEGGLEATMIDDPAPTILNDPSATVGDDRNADPTVRMTPVGVYDAPNDAEPTVINEPDQTVVDDSSPTILDEPSTPVEELSSPTIIEDSAHRSVPVADTAPTIAEDSAPTIAEDSATISEDGGSRFAPEIVLTDGVANRVIITDRQGSFIVGRDPSKANLAVDDPRASRAHFSVTFTDGHYYLTDLGSSNGTFVNGAMARGPVRLFPGDTIEFGRTTAQFRIP